MLKRPKPVVDGRSAAFSLVLVAGCHDNRASDDGIFASTTVSTEASTDDTTTSSHESETDGDDTKLDVAPNLDLPGGCMDELPNPAGAEAVLAPEYVGTYVAYDLGPVPMAQGGFLPRLGGLVVSPRDPNELLIIGPSELIDAQLHRIEVERGACGHIVGFVGGATPVLSAPYLDLMANGPQDIVFITHYPTQQISQHLPGTMALLRTDDLLALDPDHSPGGLNFVPPGYPDEGMLRLIGFPTDHAGSGGWYRSTITDQGDHYDIGTLVETTEIPNGPGGFAYIPEGSPLFATQRIIVTEWLIDPQQVSSYEVDDEGDPIPGTRKPFFERFVKPWGSYFEPQTGDYMFLQWEAEPDHIYIVQGFVPPPPVVG